jgi:hypothetical protein
MHSNTVDVKLSDRTNVAPYKLGITEATLKILTLILEFKLASSCHIARFITGRDQTKYIYRKLRFIWRAGLLESFKVLSGDTYSLYYMLSKRGLAILLENGLCEQQQIKNYPKPKTLLSWGLFKHEAQVVELASLESVNRSANLNIAFKGEDNSQGQDYINDKRIEALTPDYTVFYKTGQAEYKVYTEFERTKKANEILLNKIQRYFNFLTPENFKTTTLRLIFQTLNMERLFWLNIFMNRPSLLKLNIVTTNLDLVSTAKHFLTPVYASESSIKLTKDVQLKVEIPQRIKLFNFL